MTAMQELTRWQRIESEIKKLTGTSGWFLSQGPLYPRKEHFTLVSEGCDLTTLELVAAAMCKGFGLFIDGPINRERFEVSLTHSRHFGD